MTPALPLSAPALHPPKVKPALRGVFHFLAFFVSLGGIVELAMAPQVGWRWAAGVLYAVSLSSMLGLSALYHRPMWSHAMRARLRLVDHCGIFFVIAGSYTPFAAFAAPHDWTLGLSGMWLGAVGGIVHAFVNDHGHRGLRAAVYVVLGLSASPLVFSLPAQLGWGPVGLVLAGAAVYIAGAGVYARRWPNPKPSVFGYHEIFHLLVIVAAALHVAAVWSVQQLPSR
jgi:hemolysin III